MRFEGSRTSDRLVAIPVTCSDVTRLLPLTSDRLVAIPLTCSDVRADGQARPAVLDPGQRFGRMTTR